MPVFSRESAKRQLRNSVGTSISVASRFIPNLRVWTMKNLDTGEELKGQFQAQSPTLNVKANWASNTTLSRDTSIMQFLNGENDTFSFGGQFFKESVAHGSPETALNKLISWARKQPNILRPPIVQFWLGDGHAEITAVITGISGITYGRPDLFGFLTNVSFTVDLLKFAPFSIQDQKVTDTRYAKAKAREYYELMAQEEYGDPMIGDAIRKLHPQQPLLVEGDTVKLPSIEGIRNKRTKATSITLKTAFGNKATKQRALRIEWLSKRSVSKVSNV